MQLEFHNPPEYGGKPVFLFPAQAGSREAGFSSSPSRSATTSARSGAERVVEAARSDRDDSPRLGPLPIEPALIPVGALVVLVGAPGAGKTTFAARLVEAGLVDADDVLSADALRQEITGDASDTSRDRKVFARIRTELDDRLRTGRTAVVDATGLWPRRRARHLTVARDSGRPTVAVRFPMPIPELLARNAARHRIVPPGAVVGMARQLEVGATSEHLRAEGFDLVVDADDVFPRSEA